MTHNNLCLTRKLTILLTLPTLLISNILLAQPNVPIHADKARVVVHWTKERMANAIPRNLVIDEQGLGYLRRPDGLLEPYGHQISAQTSPGKQTPFGRPGGGNQDTAPPEISGMNPDGATIGSSHQFSAVITDDSGIKSVSFIITNISSGLTQSFNPVFAGNDTWQITLQGFSDGDWSWHVFTKDNASKGGNTATSEITIFQVDASGSGGGSGGGDTGEIVANAEWIGGDVQTAAGRIYFEMPGNAKRKGPWSGYVCSGTVVTEKASDRSVIITASHCVYDDANKAFARNVLFIPNQAGGGERTDIDCDNDPMGCWAPSFGVVDINWQTSVFPDNVEWDYAYYVVSDSGAHAGAGASSDALDVAAGSLPISFNLPLVDYSDNSDYTYALGYSYSDDPNFMYCAEDMTQEGDVNWWLLSCELSGGSSGGPWVQPMDVDQGKGPIISVNSWGYTNSPGMAGPRLDVTSAQCMLTHATTHSFSSAKIPDGDAGVAVNTCL